VTVLDQRGPTPASSPRLRLAGHFLHSRDWALADGRDWDGVGADAVARDTGGSVVDRHIFWGSLGQDLWTGSRDLQRGHAR